MIYLTVNRPPTGKFENTSSWQRQTMCSVFHCGGVFALTGGEQGI